MRQLGVREGEIDLLAGCPPCQGFSSMRTHNGSYEVIDSRNELVFEFMRFVKILKPKTIMMENVPGLATDWRLALVCKQLKKIGYHFSVTVDDAAKYGVPQRRQRMILLASRTKGMLPAKLAAGKRTVHQTIGLLPIPGGTGDELHDCPENRTTRIRQLIEAIPPDGGSRTALPLEQQLPCHQNYPNGFKDVYGRMWWHDVSPTITCGCVSPSKGRFLHPIQHRAITLREAALLQSFPRSYKFSLKHGKSGVATLLERFAARIHPSACPSIFRHLQRYRD